MALLDSLAGELLGGNTVSALSETTGASSEQVTQLVTAALPLLMTGMHQNATTEEGAEALSKALDQHATKKKEKTSEMVKEADTEDGKKAVKHILGEKEDTITEGLAKKTGMSNEQVVTALSALAPVVLSLLGNEKKSDNSSDLTSLLAGALLGGNSHKSSSLDLGGIASALLSDNDGDGKSDLGGLVSGLLGSGSGSSNGGGLGALVGSLLGGSSNSSEKESSGTGELLSGLLSNLLK